jgi:hypothetical protein
MQRIYRLQFNFNGIAKTDHVSSMDTSQGKLSLVEDIGVIVQLRNMDEAVDQYTIETNMKSLVSYRCHNSCETLPDAVPQPGNRPKASHVPFCSLGSPLACTTGLGHFEQGSGGSIGSWIDPIEDVPIDRTVHLQIRIPSNR